MKKIHLIIFTVFLNIALYSCTPQAISDTNSIETEEDCCGNGGNIPPTPPTKP